MGLCLCLFPEALLLGGPVCGSLLLQILLAGSFLLDFGGYGLLRFDKFRLIRKNPKHLALGNCLRSRLAASRRGIIVMNLPPRS